MNSRRQLVVALSFEENELHVLLHAIRNYQRAYPETQNPAMDRQAWDLMEKIRDHISIMMNEKD